MSTEKAVRLDEHGSWEGPYNRVVAMLTESDIQSALGNRMPPDPSPGYADWEAAVERVSGTDEGKRIIRDYLLDMAGELANLVAEQMQAVAS